MMRLTAALLLTLIGLAGAAGPVFWDSPADAPFRDGQWQGAALDARGGLVAGLGAEALLADSSLVIWSAVPDDRGDVWLGSGHDGRVWRVSASGEATSPARLPAEEVFAVLPGPDGLLAGCGPGGQVYAVAPDGRTTLLATVPGGYVWDLARGPAGQVYLATGSPAVIYRLHDDGRLEALATLPCRNSLDLAVDDDGSLLVAGQGPGRVFRVQPDQRSWSLLLALEQDEVRQIVRGPDGWYALGYQTEGERTRGGAGRNGSSGNPDISNNRDPFSGPFDFMVTASADVQPVRSVLVHLHATTPVRIWSSEHLMSAVAWSDDHGWLAAGARQDGGPSILWALDAPNDRRPVAAWEGGDVVDLTVVARGGKPDAVLVAQAHPGGLTRLQPVAGRDAVFEAPPLDGRHAIRWGRLVWQGEAGGGEPRFSVRTGMSPEPDPSWSDWQDLPRGQDLDLARLPASRGLQWRVALSAGSRVGGVTVSGVEPNLPPSITHFGLEPAGEMFMGSMMPSKDTVVQQFASGLKVEYNLMSRQDGRAPRQRAAEFRPLRTFTWHASDPNDDRLQHRLWFRPADDADAWRPLGDASVEQAFTWDTADLPDGWYEVQLVTDDGRDNPGDLALSTQRRLGPLPVDNTSPQLTAWNLSPHAEGFHLELEARDAFGPLGGAELTLPDGRRVRLDPGDGVCDARVESFDATVTFPGADHASPARPWTVEVQVWDLQGNLARRSGVLP